VVALIDDDAAMGWIEDCADEAATALQLELEVVPGLVEVEVAVPCPTPAVR